MSKKFGKFLLFSAVASAAAYGTYYYLQKKEQVSSSSADEDVDDDFDDFSEDLDEEEPPVKERTYVSLNLDKAEAIAQEAFHKAKEVIVDSVQQVKDTVKSVKENQAMSESNFTDLTALNKERVASDEAANEQPVSQEEANEQSVSEEDASKQILEEQPMVNPGERLAEAVVDAIPDPDSSIEDSKVQPTVSTQDPMKKSVIKETANGQVEDFFDDTP